MRAPAQIGWTVIRSDQERRAVHRPTNDCIKAFSETDFMEDLKKIDVPTLVMHGDDDQIVPLADAGPLSAKLLKKAKTRFYPENRKR
jgi:pimeloyl-ACP methyl ester carboxylesterase